MIALDDGTGRAEIALTGAELKSWSVEGTPLIWPGDSAIWPETAPILFPVVGWTRGGRVGVAGTSYPLGLHGFARTLPFRVIEQWPTHVRLRLEASDETRALYPFDWSLEVEYTLKGASLDMRLQVGSESRQPMPYACGLHPGFRWPFAGGAPEDYEIVFSERESAAVPVISAEGLFTRQSRRVPMDGRRLPLSTSLFEREALCFLDARSQQIRFSHRSGGALAIALHDFPHIALWSRAPGAFLAIEAWTGHGDHVDADGDLERKPSMRHLAPGALAEHGARYTYSPPHRLGR